MISRIGLLHRMACLLVFMLGMIAVGFGQLTLTVTSIPAGTPADDDIYIAGNFNSWNPGDAAYVLTDLMNGSYAITFSPAPGTLEYKFIRGSWETVEGNASGNFIPNRTYTYTGGVKNIEVSIAGWEDGTGGNHTAADNVEILDEDFYIPQLDRNRRIWLYLPPDYDTSSKNYPVIYMQDGQNLFDVYYSFSGEWKIDESMNDLFDDGDYGAIVVGIDNGGGERINEYSPWYNPSYGGGDGEAYASFLVNTLKPYIDSSYRTLPGREYTAIAGSSMGGNISMYAGIEYQDVFGKVGIFSPAFWFSDSSYLHLAQKGITQDLRIYFVASQNESSTMIPNMMAMYDALIDAGQDENQMFFLNEVDGAHSEWFWAREYPDAYEWLFDELVLSEKFVNPENILMYPNPATDYLTIETDRQDLDYTVYSSVGDTIMVGALSAGTINTSRLLTGTYFIILRDRKGKVVFSSAFVKK